VTRVEHDLQIYIIVIWAITLPITKYNTYENKQQYEWYSTTDFKHTHYTSVDIYLATLSKNLHFNMIVKVLCIKFNVFMLHII